MENGLHGVMEGLNDPYSVYYTADEYKELQISTTGTYYGIGAALKQDLTPAGDSFEGIQWYTFGGSGT